MFTIYELATGQIIKTVSVPPFEGALNMQYDSEIEGVIDGQYINDHYVEDGVAVLKPLRQRDTDSFDYGLKAWVDMRPDSAVREAKRTEVNLALVRKLNAPLEFDNVLVDADRTAVDNIKAKVDELALKVSQNIPVPSSQLVWRDKDNVNALFATVQEYQTWLTGLLVAISDRNAAARQWSWAKKAEIDAATSIENIEAVSLT